jgi:hypothetical protein
VELPNNLDNSPLTAEPAGLRVSLTAISPSGPGAQKEPENPALSIASTVGRRHVVDRDRQDNPEDLKQFRRCRRSFFLTGRRYVDPVI